MLTRGRLWCCLMVLLAPLLAACQNGGHFSILGYTTHPNYDCEIRTVYVPIFQNVTFRRGLEFDLTRAVIREIESKTPYKVVSNCESADTELLGKIVTTNKSLITFNQLGEVREAESGLGVELVWRDMRAGSEGRHLSGDMQKPHPAYPGPDIPVPATPLPSRIQPNASFVPELGGSLTSAEKLLVDRAAIQIVSMMEVWK